MISPNQERHESPSVSSVILGETADYKPQTNNAVSMLRQTSILHFLKCEEKEHNVLAW